MHSMYLDLLTCVHCSKRGTLVPPGGVPLSMEMTLGVNSLGVNTGVGVVDITAGVKIPLGVDTGVEVVDITAGVKV